MACARIACLFGDITRPRSILLLCIGATFDDLNIVLWSDLMLLISNVVFACLKARERILFLMLHCGIFLFLLSRPAVALFDSTKDWHLSTPDSTFFALFIIFLSLVFLRLGVLLYSFARRSEGARCRRLHIFCVNEPSEGEAPRRGLWVFGKRFNSYVMVGSLVLFCICLLGTFLLGVQRLSYMSGRAYEDYYLASLTDYSWSWVGDLELMLPFSLCAYLATLPKKRPATIALVLFVASTVPLLIIGARTDFVMAVLLMGVYYVIRNALDGPGSWIGRKEKFLVCVGVPVGVLAMGAVNYIRADSAVRPEGAFALLGDTLYKQGVSFRVLGYGYDYYPQISALGPKFYSFEPFIHNITQGFVGQVFLGMPLLPDTNSAELALQGHSYGNTLSYFAHPNYLGGEGYGSSYLLELYTDFGFVGVALFSLVFGMLSVWLAGLVGRNWFSGMAGLLACYYVFHIPRGTVLEWMSFVFKTRFWLACVLIVVLSTLIAVACSRNAVKSVLCGEDRKGSHFLLQRFGLDEVSLFRFENACIPVVDWKNSELRKVGCGDD